MKWVGLVQVLLLAANVLFFYINASDQKSLHARSVHSGPIDDILNEARSAVQAQNRQFRLAAAKVGLNLDDEGSSGNCADELKLLKTEINAKIADMKKYYEESLQETGYADEGIEEGYDEEMIDPGAAGYEDVELEEDPTSGPNE